MAAFLTGANKTLRCAAYALLFMTASLALAEEVSGIKEAETFASQVLGEECDHNGMTEVPVGVAEPESLSHYVYDLTYRYSYQANDEPDRKATLYQIFCGSGAYNILHAFVLKNDETESFKLVSFAEPNLKTDYTDDEQTTVKAGPVVTGFATRHLLVNAKFDPTTSTVKSYGAWRGIGDAWDSGDWRFEGGAFVLKRYEIDPTFNGADEQATAPETYVVFQAP